MADQYRYRDDYRGSSRDNGRYGRDDYRAAGASGRFRDDDYRQYDNRYGNRDDSRAVPIDENRRLISSDKVQGTRVYNYSGERLGTIRNVMIEKRRGKVEYAVMSFGGFLGLGERYFPIPWAVLQYDERLDGYAVDIDQRDLERAPSFRAGEEPVYDYGYARDVYGYYGVPY